METLPVKIQFASEDKKKKKKKKERKPKRKRKGYEGKKERKTDREMVPSFFFLRIEPYPAAIANKAD